MSSQRAKTHRKKKEFDPIQLPTYVINLSERPDRWKRFRDQPATHSLKRLHRFKAINGKRLDFLKDKRISMRTKLNIFRNYRRSHHEIATLGAVGSSLSHIAAWRRFVASGAPLCLILEDDAIVTDDQLKKVADLVPTLPEGWGMWLLGFYKPNLHYASLEGAAAAGWNRVYNFTAAHAYILKREAAIKLLEEPYPVETHIEYYITACSVLKDFTIVQHPDVHIEFFRKERDRPRTRDSNTSQHKKSGCPTCNVADDYSQIYRGNERPTKEGMKVDGVVRGQQSNILRKMIRRKTRKLQRPATEAAAAAASVTPLTPL